jgi:hypothetical protein
MACISDRMPAVSPTQAAEQLTTRPVRLHSLETRADGPAVSHGESVVVLRLHHPHGVALDEQLTGIAHHSKCGESRIFFSASEFIHEWRMSLRSGPIDLAGSPDDDLFDSLDSVSLVSVEFHFISHYGCERRILCAELEHVSLF